MKSITSTFAASSALIIATVSCAPAHAISSADVVTPYYGSLDRSLGHLQNETTNLKSEIRPKIADLYSQVGNNTDWNDRQEGVIRQSRGRLDGHDQDIADNKAHADRNTGLAEANQREVQDAKNQIGVNTERSIGNQQQISVTDQRTARNAEAIAANKNAQGVTDQRSINNAGRLDTAERNIASTIDQQDADRNASQTRDDELRAGQRQQGNRIDDVTDQASVDRQESRDNDDRIESESRDRDAMIARQADTDRQRSQQADDRIERESIERDGVIAQQVDYQAQVNAAYRRQTSDQFAQHKAAIQSNTQAINDERDARQDADRDLQAGIASAIAAGSHIMDANYRGVQVSVAGGAYRGASAASLAVGGAVSDSTFIHLNVSHDSRGHQAVGGNVNFKF